MEEKKLEAVDSTQKEEVRLLVFDGVKKFKSIKRAIRRGNASPIGQVYPTKPFNCRKATRGRALNELKKKIHGEVQRTF